MEDRRRHQEKGGQKKGAAGFWQGFTRSLRNGMDVWNKAVEGTKASSNKPSSGGASRGRVDATDNGVSFARPQHHRTAKSRRHEAALQRKEAALRRALELQRELRRIEAEQVRLEEQLSRARAHQLEAEVSAQALGAEGNRILAIEARQSARAASHEIDLIYDSLRDLHRRASDVKRDPAFLRRDDASRAYEEAVAYRRAVLAAAREDDELEAEFRMGAARCGFCAGVALSEEVHYCEECGSANCQECIDRFGVRCLNCRGRAYGNVKMRDKRRRRKSAAGVNGKGARPRSYAGHTATAAASEELEADRLQSDRMGFMLPEPRMRSSAHHLDRAGVDFGEGGGVRTEDEFESDCDGGLPGDPLYEVIK